MQQNALYMIDKIILFFFPSERLFLPLFGRSKQGNNLLRPLLIPPFLNLPAQEYRFMILKTACWLIGLRALPDKLDVDWFK